MSPRVGLCLATGDIETARPASLAELARQARQAEEIGFDSIWVQDHYWVENDKGRRVGVLEPMTMLAYLAAVTCRVRLGTLVLCNAFRHPGQLAREAATLADASGGRFVLGLGAGWYRGEFAALGLPFARRVSALEETLRALPSLLAGRRVKLDGDYLQLVDAEVVTTTPRPPVWLAAFGPRMVDITARLADGWHASFLSPDPSWFAAQARAVRSSVALAGRDVARFVVSAGIHVLPVTGSEREAVLRRALRLAGGEGDRPLSERAVIGATDEVLAAIRSYGAAGAEEVIVNLSLDPFGGFDASYVERMEPVIRALKAG